MEINEDLYQRIVNAASPLPPETGGIIGGKNDKVTTFLSDKGINTGKRCSYHPNVKLLNRAIGEWQAKEIDFMGIYHTHFYGVGSLSDGDKNYIFKIMKSMPESVEKLYFPIIVMPDKDIVCYSAKIQLGKLIIDRENLRIIESKEKQDGRQQEEYNRNS